MDRTTILRTSEEKFTGKRPAGQQKVQAGTGRHQTGKCWQEIKRNILWEERRDWRLFVNQPIC
jgi:hypothetical protein